MGFLRKIYPGAFKVEKKVVKPFVIRMIVLFVLQIVIGVICGAPIGVAMALAEVSQNVLLMVVAIALEAILMAVATVAGVYLTGGMVISALKFAGVIKDQPKNDEAAVEAEAAEENTAE